MNHAVLDPERRRHGHAQSGGRAVRERRRRRRRERRPAIVFSRRRRERERRREKVSLRESPSRPSRRGGHVSASPRRRVRAGKFHRVVPSLEADAKELGSAVKKEGAISSPPRVSFVWGTCDAQPRSEAWCAPPTFDARRVAAVCGVEYDEPKSVSPESVSPERLSIVSRSSPSSSSSLGADAKEPKGETSANANERERERERPKKTDATAGTDDEPRDFRRLSANRAPSGDASKRPDELSSSDKSDKSDERHGTTARQKRAETTKPMTREERRARRRARRRCVRNLSLCSATTPRARGDGACGEGSGRARRCRAVPLDARRRRVRPTCSRPTRTPPLGRRARGRRRRRRVFSRTTRRTRWRTCCSATATRFATERLPGRSHRERRPDAPDAARARRRRPAQGPRRDGGGDGGAAPNRTLRIRTE